MNSLVILPQELSSEGFAILVGPRAIYGFETHELRSGQEVRCAVLGGRLGTALVISATREHIRLSVSLKDSPPKRLGVTLAVGISRPQTVKKILQGAAMAGVEAVHFVRAERSEKSYLQSKAMDESEVERQLILGLEQVWDSVAPNVCIHNSLSRFLSSEVTKCETSLKIIADPRGAPLIVDFQKSVRTNVIVAIGPEGGWSETELAQANESKFISARIGERAVRVETAMTYFLGIVQYERERSELR